MAFPHLPRAFHLSMAAPNARRGGIRRGFTYPRGIVRKMFREGCKDAARASRAKNITKWQKSNPVELYFLGIPRLIASIASRLVSLSMLADTRI
jgi:hypothetical protein